MEKKFTYLTAMTCSISYKKQLPPATLIALLSGKKRLDNTWVFHISTLFDEVPTKYLSKALLENNISIENANKLYQVLPSSLQNGNCLEAVNE